VETRIRGVQYIRPIKRDQDDAIGEMLEGQEFKLGIVHASPPLLL
jgi:hypothetical protein